MTTSQQKRILTMNQGSASVKATLYEAANDAALLFSMVVDQGGGSAARLKIIDSDGVSLFDAPVDGGNGDGNGNASSEAMFAWLEAKGALSGLAAIGHRLVHGGTQYREPQLITPQFLSEMKQLVPLDPDHMPAAMRGIQFVAEKFPALPQVACFDTAFHSSLPTIARMYALPRKLYQEGIQRYGFHGLSYEYIMGKLTALDGELARGRVVIAHLGSGASMVAVHEGKSVDTSMGFTPLEGLVMSTRSGDVDPGLLLYLLGEKKMSPQEMTRLLNKESGLLGVSGISSDMKTLVDAMNKDESAAEAVDLFCYRAKKYVGAYAAVLGGLDILIFAGGIGEHAPLVRKRICDGLNFLGIQLDGASNDVNAELISSAGSRVKVRVIKTDEDRMIVRHVLSTLGWERAETLGVKNA